MVIPVVLLSFILVLAAAVTLVIGLVGTGLALIYISIACSLAAGLVLAVAVVRSRPQAELATAGPSPLNLPEPRMFAPEPTMPTSLGGGIGVLDRDEPSPFDVDEAPADEGIRILDRVEEGEEPAGEEIVSPSAEAVEADDVEVAAEEPAPEWTVRDDDWAASNVFPIADYDSLRVSQILPLLPELDADELVRVRAHEVGAKGGRVSVVNKIDQLLGRPVAAKPAPARKAPAKKAAPTTAKKAAAAKKPASTAAKKAAAPKKAAAGDTPVAPVKKAAAKKAGAPATKATKSTKATKATKATKKPSP